MIERNADDDGSKNSRLRRELIVPWGELAVVLCAAIGYPLYVSTKLAIYGPSPTDHYVSANSKALYNLIWESSTLLVLLGYLRWRGWAVSDFRVLPSWRSTGVGVLLWGIVCAAHAWSLRIFLVLEYLYRHHHSQLAVSSSLQISGHYKADTILILILANVVNVFFEEILFMGYAFNEGAAKLGPFISLILLVILRIACHTYLGISHALALGVLFLIFGLYFWRAQNLWPLVTAHILFNLRGFIL